MMAPQFAQVLGRTMPVERLIRTVVVSCERNNDLVSCNRQTLFNAAMTFAVLGLEVDGVTGQGFLVPFKGQVQPIIGYLGYNTLAARAGMTVTGRVVREGDEFEFDESCGHIRHIRHLGGETGPHKRRIIAAWAKASAKDRPAVVRVLSIDELMDTKAKSPRGTKAPWADFDGGGFAAMCEKTAKRRLRRDMPLNVYQLAGAMEEAHEERGLHSWIHPDKGAMVGSEVIAPNHNDTTPTATQLINPPSLREQALKEAERGTPPFRDFWRGLSTKQKAEIEGMTHEGKSYIEHLKTTAEKSDKEFDNDEPA